jgi:hypothetical protein
LSSSDASQPVRAPGPHVEQDGREVLLVELGAARERVSWLLAQNQQLGSEIAEAKGQVQAGGELVAQAQGRATTWRLVGIVAIGAYAIQALIKLLPDS